MLQYISKTKWTWTVKINICTEKTKAIQSKDTGQPSSWLRATYRSEVIQRQPTFMWNSTGRYFHWTNTVFLDKAFLPEWCHTRGTIMTSFFQNAWRSSHWLNIVPITLQGIFLQGGIVSALLQEDTASPLGGLQIPTERTCRCGVLRSPEPARPEAHNLEKSTCEWTTAARTTHHIRQTRHKINPNTESKTKNKTIHTW